MPKQPESKFRQKAMADLKEIRGTHWLRIEQQSLRGTPDCLGTAWGKFVAIEFKRGAGVKPTALQQYTLELIQKAGGITFVAHPDNWHNVLAEILDLGRGFIWQ